MAFKFKAQGRKRTKKSSTPYQSSKRKRSSENEEAAGNSGTSNASKEKKEHEETNKGPGSVSEWRIVLVGKTGAGKSSAGNTILGREVFESELSPSSLTSECKKESGEVGGRKVSIIDTPGLYDTNLSNEDVWKRIKMCIGMSSPGPHAFLVVLQLGRFTEEERETVKMIQETFGEDAYKHIMLLFTHGDRLKKQTIQEYLSKSKDLQDITQKCNNRYHVFNNNADDPSQVSQLLDKIEKIIGENGGSHYTTEMYLKAEEAIEKEKERILRESEAARNKELDELKAKFTGEMLEFKKEMMKKRHEDEARAAAEKNNTVHNHYTTNKSTTVICVIS